MIIVSQDKEKATEKINLYIFRMNNNFQILVNGAVFGIYKTEERAKEALQEIITAYSDFEYYKNASKKEKEEISRLMKAEYKHFDTYEMPEN